MSKDKIRKEILALVSRYYRAAHLPKQFKPGDRVSYGGRVFDEKELQNLVSASLDFWLTAGPYTEAFEASLAKRLEVRFASFVNSGSSANLLAVAALTSPSLGHRRLCPGDEVITVACGFPTTVTPIFQHGCIPVFVDVTLPSYNIDVTLLEPALSKKTKAVMVAHTLGNPFDAQAVSDFCKKHELWLVEDNCDAMGARCFIDGKWRYTGSIGDIGTSSFYPAHHITTGEGGAVYTNNPTLNRLIASFRDWGRDCWCKSGHDDTCKNRFNMQQGELPHGYDHKYVYAHFGYNMHATEMQAAVGSAQLEKLDGFIEARNANWATIQDRFRKYENYLILPEPQPNSAPSWFGYVVTLQKDAPFTRKDIIQFVESKGIQTRMLFAGNITRHPCFDAYRDNPRIYRVSGVLTNTDTIMNNTFWIGVYPGLDSEKTAYMLSVFDEWFEKHC